MIARNVRDGRAGIRQVGTPAADCTGMLAAAAEDYPDDLLRILAVIMPEGTLMQENGAVEGDEPETYIIFRNGVPVLYVGFPSSEDRWSRRMRGRIIGTLSPSFPNLVARNH